MTKRHSVYFVRHGQTVWNVENKICGAIDSPLTELGHQQAVEAGEKIRAMNLGADMILYSPLSRAADTAKHISEITGIPCQVEPRLVEQSFGKWEGTPRDGADFHEAKKQFADNFENGESMFRVAQRIYNLLDELREDTEHTYILVAHNGISRIVKTYFYSMDNEAFSSAKISNCEVVEYTFE